MKKYIMIAIGALAVSSCASFNGAAQADHNGDGLVSREELMTWQRRHHAESMSRNTELERFRHVGDIISTADSIINRFAR